MRWAQRGGVGGARVWGHGWEGDLWMHGDLKPERCAGVRCGLGELRVGGGWCVCARVCGEGGLSWRGDGGSISKTIISLHTTLHTIISLQNSLCEPYTWKLVSWKALRKVNARWALSVSRFWGKKSNWSDEFVRRNHTEKICQTQSHRKKLTVQ